MIDNDKYMYMINNNKYLTECHKKNFRFLYSKINTKYVGRDSNKQFATYIHDNINKFQYMGKLSELLFHFCDNTHIINKIIKKIIKNKFITDKKVIEYLVHKLKTTYIHQKIYNKELCNKWDYIFQNLFLKYKELNTNISNIKYLDYGCGNGSKTNKFANNFKLNKENIYGCDIKSWGPYEQKQIKHNFNFKYISENEKIDFHDNKFDIITCFFVLHHIKNLENTMKELQRVIKPNGILLIFEHNIIDDSEFMLLDIEHLLYEIIYNKNYEYFNNPIYAQYYNYIEWDYIMNKFNFNYVKSHVLFTHVNNNFLYDNSFYAFYKINK
jgi:ubiquinone/menaquinone biosynthesis C-methylase UbiE